MSLFSRFPKGNGLGPTHVAAALGGGAGLALTGGIFRPEAPLAACFALGATAAAIAWEDWRALRVPDVLNLLLLIFGIAAAFHAQGSDRIAAFAGCILIDILVCAGSLWLVRAGYRRLARRDGLGLGDVKFAGAAAPWIGWQFFPSVILIASLSALAFLGMAMLLNGTERRDPRIPFASFLAPALAAVWLVLLPH